MKDEQALNELREIENGNIGKVLELLSGHEGEILANIAKIVASLCDIDCDTMMGSSTKYYSAQCRWLFWYTYRYMTNEPYNKMSKRIGKHGHEYTPSALTIGVNKMAQMVETDTIWKKRWIILKSIIKSYDGATLSPLNSCNDIQPVKVVITKHKNVEVKVEIKEV